MDIRVVLGLSILLQLGAAGLALWLIRVTGKRLAWTLLAIAIALMAVRRSLSLWYMSDADTAPTLELAAELVALLISMIMIMGVALIVPLFRSIQRSEEALRESEAQFRGLADSAFDGVVLHDGNVILEANAAFARMFGFEEGEVAGRSMADFVVADTKRIAVESNLAAPEEPYELDAVHRDGQAVRLEVCGRPTTHNGREARVLAVRDITRRKEAERRLRFQSSAIEQSTEGLAMADSEGNLSFINKAFATMHGYEPAELLGQHLSMFHTAEQTPAVQAANAQMREQGAFCGEIWHVRRDGTVFPSQMHNSLVLDAEGKPVGMLATMRDITESKKAESELRESEEKWRSLVENAPAFIMTVERDGSVRWMNRAPRGHRPEEVIGSTVYDHVESEYHATMRDALDHVFKTGETTAFENRAPGADGAISWYANNLAPIIHDGKVVLATLIATDITDRKHAEDALRRAHDALERRVEERTSELRAANERLRHEIAERERIEAALRESEAQYRHLFQNAQVGIYRSTIDGSRMLAANEKLASVFGSSSVEELLSGPPLARWADTNARAELVRTLERDGVVTDFEVPVLTKSGERRILLASVRVHREQGYLEGTAIDVTDRRAAEQALRESEERFRTVVGASKDAIIAIDEGGRITLFNPAAERMFGRSSSEMLGHRLDILMPETFRNGHQDHIEGYFKHGSPSAAVGRTIELPAIRSDGSELPIELSLSIGSYHGERFALAVIRDVTDRKRTEEELHKSSKRYVKLAEEQRVLLEHTRDFLYRHDTDGIFNYLSPAVESTTGYTVDEWTKHYTTYMTDTPMNQEVIKNTEEALRTGKEGPAYLVEIAHKDGHPVTLEVNERPYFEHGDVAGIIGVARDVTERVRVQAELKKAKEAAEAANKAKSIFLANMSHEIRTPITAMLGAAELLTTKPPELRKEDQADVILRNGRHLIVLIDDLLDLSQAESGKLEIKTRPCSLLEVMADVEAVTRPLHRRSAVDFRTRFETEIPNEIHTDPTRLKQALINLISNALKFTEVGRVWVRVRVDRDLPDPRLVIAVEDTGPGVSNDDVDRIFDTFTQADAGRTCHNGGVGLGLPLARWIAQQLGGTVDVETSTESGSMFALRVATGPLDEAEWLRVPDTAIAVERAVTTGDGDDHRCLDGCVLLAEDFTDTRKLIAQALTDRGARVTAVANGREAVDAAAAQPYDLIILDVRMPEMDGPTAVAELRRRGCTTPIMALTALTAKADLEAVLEAGFDDVWTKPVTLEQLVRKAGVHIGVVRAGPTQAGPAPPEPVVGGSLASSLAAVRAEFVRRLPDQLATIKKALAGQDRERLNELLHQLVGAGGIHGFMPISLEAARLQKLAHTGVLAELQDALGSLEKLIEQAVESTPAGTGPFS